MFTGRCTTEAPAAGRQRSGLDNLPSHHDSFN